jgi:hypothetical protein
MKETLSAEISVYIRIFSAIFSPFTSARTVLSSSHRERQNQGGASPEIKNRLKFYFLEANKVIL